VRQIPGNQSVDGGLVVHDEDHGGWFDVWSQGSGPAGVVVFVRSVSMQELDLQ
jgi:hypothetical protein